MSKVDRIILVLCLMALTAMLVVSQTIMLRKIDLLTNRINELTEEQVVTASIQDDIIQAVNDINERCDAQRAMTDSLEDRIGQLDEKDTELSGDWSATKIALTDLREEFEALDSYESYKLLVLYWIELSEAFCRQNPKDIFCNPY